MFHGKSTKVLFFGKKILGDHFAGAEKMVLSICICNRLQIYNPLERQTRKLNRITAEAARKACSHISLVAQRRVKTIEAVKVSRSSRYRVIMAKRKSRPS